jgi:hypothetical protein
MLISVLFASPPTLVTSFNGVLEEEFTFEYNENLKRLGRMFTIK